MPDWLVFLRTLPAQPGEGPLMAQAAICPADTGAQAVTAVLAARLMFPQPGAVIEAVDVADARVYDVELNATVTRQGVGITPPIAPDPVDPGWTGGIAPESPPDDAHPEHPIVLPPDEPPIPDTEPVDEPTPSAMAEFTFAPPRPTRGTNVNFDGTPSSGAGSVTSWIWDFGDGSTDTGQQVSYQYKGKGDYVVSLVVTDEADQTAEQTQTVTVT